MHHGPAERPAVAAWLYGYRTRCVESAVFHAFASYGLVIRTFSRGQSIESNPGSSIHRALKASEDFNFCGITEHVSYIIR